MWDLKSLRNFIDPHKNPDKQYFLDLLDGDKQREYENKRISAVMSMLKALYISALKKRIAALRAEREELTNADDYDAEKYRRVLGINAEISVAKKKMDGYKPFFAEPYFARMDLTDPEEGYNSYYIGKKGDAGLEILDWRAPLARKYYQKSRTAFSINKYDYKLVLRRALRTMNGKVLDIKNEYLSLSDYLTPEEIGGRDEELVFDPYLKEILKSRKEKEEITDIIETIQEKQYEIITLPERDEFVLQGVAGSGKTMIMLHRLSYIMYNNEGVKPSDVLVITPSDSFNAFIDELSAVLELEKVRTSTLDNYFMSMLSSVGVDIADKFDWNMPVNGEYFSYIYSDKFVSDVKKRLGKIYDGVFGMFASSDCAETVGGVVAAAERQIALYEKIKNAGVRVRRCVLGEIKEKPDGGLYYTKQFRYMFNCVLDVREFLELVANDARMGDYAFFYRQFLSFYRSVRYLRRYSEKICLTAVRDLGELKTAADKEITDLKRYRMKTSDGEAYTYAEGIEKREFLKREADDIARCVNEICEAFGVLYDFADVLRSEDYLVSIGRCENTTDVLRFFFRDIVRKAKNRLSMPVKPLCRCDAFALCLILCELGYNLSPKFSFIFVDEGQDVSFAEYSVLRKVNDRAAFNVFGDLKQNMTSFRGITDWSVLGLKIYDLNLNYRNTNEIVDYVSEHLGIEMKSIGLCGGKVERVEKRAVTGWLSSKNGLKALICSEKNIETYSRKSYNLPGKTGRISKSRINLLTVYESKGLEFTAVAVADGDLTVNEKYIAYTRALKELAVIK